MANESTWSSWSGDHECRPERIERPRDHAELAAAIERAADAERVVRVAGSGHSSSDVVMTGGTLVSLDRMDAVLDVDTATGLVRCEAGITLHALSEALWPLGLGLENLGDIDVQSVGGAMATGTHGTGERFRNLSSTLHSIEVMLADGSTVELSEASDSDGWRAARVSVGALGVVTAVTIRAVPAFALRSLEQAQPLAEVLDGLDEILAATDHFGFFTFPHSPLALTYSYQRTGDAPEPRSRARAWTEDILVTNHGFHLGCHVGRVVPRAIPSMNRLVARLAPTAHRINRSHRVFCSPRSVPFTEMEYAIPREHAREAVLAIRELIERERFPVSFPLEVRFTAGDDAFLSPACERDTCFVGVIVFRGLPWRACFEAFEATMAGLGGRPHWGKRHFRTAEQLSGDYAHWESFAAVRARMDPDGRFANDYVRRTLVGEEEPAAALTPAARGEYRSTRSP